MSTRRGPESPSKNWKQTLDEAELRAGPDLMVALDIDGTIVHYDTSLSPRVRDAIRAHVEAGTQIMISTGRSVWGTQIVLDQLGLEFGYAVSSNGALVLSLGDTHAESDTTEIPRDIQYDGARDVRLWRSHTFNPEREISLVSEGIPEALMAVESKSLPPLITAPFPPGEIQSNARVVPVSDLSIADATRLTVRAPNMHSADLASAIDSLGLAAVQYNVGWNAWIDISPPGVSKATGLEDVRQEIGVAPQRTLTMGDSGNDKEMLAWAGVGIAMGGSDPAILPYADAIGATVEDDGVALVLEHLL